MPPMFSLFWFECRHCYCFVAAAFVCHPLPELVKAFETTPRRTGTLLTPILIKMNGRTNQNDISNALLNNLNTITQTLQELTNMNANNQRSFSFSHAAEGMAKSKLEFYDGSVDPEVMNRWFRLMERQFGIYSAPEN